MNKRITSLLLSLVMVLTMLATAMPVFAASYESTVLTVSADKTTANPGDTITFTVTMGPVSEMGSMQMRMEIPTGLTYVPNSGKVADNLRTNLGFDVADWTEVTLMINGGASATDYESDTNTVFGTFQCTVDEGFSGTASVGLWDLEFGSCETFEFHTDRFSVKTADVTVVAKPVAVASVSLDKSTLTLNAGATGSLTATVAPGNATNKAVTWTSSDTSVATVADGVVTALKKGTATITVKTADGNKTATCAVTVNCAHANTTNHAAVASTCKVQGNAAYTTCNDCGEVINGSSAKLPLADHTYGTLVAEIPATHTVAGTIAHYECSVCNKYFTETNAASEITDLTIPAMGHDTGLAWQKNDTHHWKDCSCGEELEKATHSWGWVTTLPATEDTTGLKHEQCSVCGAKRNENTEIPKLDHTHDFTFLGGTASSCTVAGTVDHYHCIKCGKDYADNTGAVELTDISAPLAAHEFTLLQCDNTQHWHKCANCSATDTPANHDFTGAYKTDANRHWHECLVCGIIDVELTHDFDNDQDMVCDTCGYDRSHTHGNGVLQKGSAASCITKTDGMKDYYVCSCGDNFYDAACTNPVVNDADLVIAWAHTPDYEAPTEDHGVKCTVCGEELFAKLPKIIEGKNGTFTRGSAAGLAFRSDAEFETFGFVKVDGDVVDAANYTAVSGSTLVTLKPEYLETLALGVHTIAISSGNYLATANFTVQTVISLPIEKIVTKGGTAEPGAQTFEFELFNFGYGRYDYDAPAVTGNIISTNGVNTYNGNIQIVVTDEEMFGNLTEGFYLREKAGNAENWTYSDAVYFVRVIQIEDTIIEWKFANCTLSSTDDGEYYLPEDTILGKASFTNTYTADAPEQPTEPEKPETPSFPDTGDNGNIFLWIALMLVSVAGLTGVAVFSKKKRVR